MSWLSSLFSGSSNPANSAIPYLQQIPGQVSPYLDPFFQAGKGMLDPLTQQYSSLMSNPGARMNEIGGEFEHSPGYQASVDQAMKASNNASAAGGMAGTPQNEYNSMKMATDLSNQDYYNWLESALGLYNTGLSGGQQMAGMGLNAGKSMADMIAQALSGEAGYSYAGQAGKNQNMYGFMGDLAKAMGSAVGWGNTPKL